MKILVVEDDRKLGSFVRKGLEAQGFVVDYSADGDEGRVRFFAHLERQGQDTSFGEASRFRRVQGRWLYHSGT